MRTGQLWALYQLEEAERVDDANNADKGRILRQESPRDEAQRRRQLQVRQQEGVGRQRDRCVEPRAPRGKVAARVEGEELDSGLHSEEVHEEYLGCCDKLRLPPSQPTCSVPAFLRYGIEME